MFPGHRSISLGLGLGLGFAFAFGLALRRSGREPYGPWAVEVSVVVPYRAGLFRAPNRFTALGVPEAS